MAVEDPRVQILVDEFGAEPYRARGVLQDLDALSPNATIRRLQQTLNEDRGDEPAEWDLARAVAITAEVRDLVDLQRELKRAFAADELDGGWATALQHPLYVKAEARIASLRDEMKGLI